MVNGLLYLTPDALDLPTLKELDGTGLVENEVTGFPVDADIVLGLIENEPELIAFLLLTIEEALLPVVNETMWICRLLDL